MRMKSWMAALAALIGIVLLPSPAAAQALTQAEAREIAEEAYIYAYPLVLSELTRQSMLASGWQMNRLSHRRAFPDPSATFVVRPNADTLYSTAWYDVSERPLLVSVPDAGERYYLIQLLDMWTDTFGSLGTRTTGNRAQRIAIVGPDWHGTLPDGVEAIRSPTPIGLFAIRARTDGVADYAAVHAFQDGVALESLGAGPQENLPVGAAVRRPPAEQIAAMDGPAFFATFAQVLAITPPHANDQPALARIRRLGIVPGRPFDVTTAPPAVQDAVRAAPAAAQARIRNNVGRGIAQNGWLPLAQVMGTYGTYYLSRASIGFAGLFMNSPEDAIYPTLSTGPDGAPLDSARRYVLHFDRGRTPPARAFWSVTMYDAHQFFTPNPAHRYAIGDRDNLRLNPDGSLDLYIQRDAPGGERDRNWLPTPASGPFSLTLRLYWPEADALEGRWAPPAIRVAP